MHILKLFKSIYTLFTFLFNISCVKKDGDKNSFLSYEKIITGTFTVSLPKRLSLPG